MNRPDSSESAEAFKGVLDALNDAVFASDSGGLVLYANGAAGRLLGWPVLDLLGKPLTTIVPSRLRADFEQAFRRFMATGQSGPANRPIRVPALHRGGGEIDVELTLSELRPEPGRTLVLAVVRDLRERVELEPLEREEELQRAWTQADAARRNLEQLFEDAPAAIAIIRGPEMRYQLSNAINQRYAAGRPMVGRTIHEALPELEAAGVGAIVQQVYATGEPFAAREYPVTLPATSESPARPAFINGVIQPFRGDTGEIEGVMVFGYDVTDLVAARDEAQRAIGIRDQFLSIASHELRTPLTSLVLQLSSLSRFVQAGTLGTLPPEKLKGRVLRMEQQAARLTSLVGELLDVSRISAGRLAIDRQPTDLVEIVKEVLERVTDEATHARSPLSLHAPDTLPGIWDRNRLDQVVTNIVGNAIKYAGGEPIDVIVTRRRDSACVAVRDRGPGIDMADQKRVFQQFERASPPALAGFGLGLWIASRIVEAHGGTIELESRLGEGATFTVEVPITSPS